jgi:hypothetical protein
VAKLHREGDHAPAEVVAAVAEDIPNAAAR